jgi:hypothetical protein
MMEINLKNKKARIWLDELPNLYCQETDVAKHVIVALPSPISGYRRAALEVLRHIDGPSSYGLLQAEFTPAHSGQLSIEVAISVTSRRKMEWSLASTADNVWIGLRYEYVEPVIDGALGAAQILGSGVLRFQCGAYGDVGSSPMLFRHLSRIVVDLLAHEQGPLSGDEIRLLLRFPRQ